MDEELVMDNREALKKIHNEPRVRSLLWERGTLVRIVYRQAEVNGLRLDRVLTRKATRLGVVSLPDQGAPLGKRLYTKSPITGDVPRLNAYGVAEVRESIRKEKKARRQPWLDWLPWIVAAAATLAWLFEKFGTSPSVEVPLDAFFPF